MGTDRTRPEGAQAQSAIPEAVVTKVAHNRKAPKWESVYGDTRATLAAIPPLTGPGPNEEWGRYEQVGWVNKYDELSENINPDARALWEPVYRFVPEATDGST